MKERWQKENTAKQKLASFHGALWLALSWSRATGFVCVEQMGHDRLNLVFLDVGDSPEL